MKSIKFVMLELEQIINQYYLYKLNFIKIFNKNNLYQKMHKT